MEHKGYVTETGRVVTTTRSPIDPGLARAGVRFAANGDRVVGELHYDEQRYNLRRVLVSRTWYVVPIPRPDGLVRDEAVAAADTRREAIALALPRLTEPQE